MKTTKQTLKPAEGLCIKLPNGKPALQFISYRNISVWTTSKEDNTVSIKIEFDEPFIKKKSDDERSLHHS